MQRIMRRGTHGNQVLLGIISGLSPKFVCYESEYSPGCRRTDIAIRPFAELLDKAARRIRDLAAGVAALVESDP